MEQSTLNLSPQTMAAIRLQSAYRGRRERRNRLTKKKAATRIQNTSRISYDPYPDATRSIRALPRDTPLQYIDDLAILDKITENVREIQIAKVIDSNFRKGEAVFWTFGDYHNPSKIDFLQGITYNGQTGISEISEWIENNMHPSDFGYIYAEAAITMHTSEYGFEERLIDSDFDWELYSNGESLFKTVKEFEETCELLEELSKNGADPELLNLNTRKIIDKYNLNYTTVEKDSLELYELFLSEEQLDLSTLHEKFNEYFWENISDFPDEVDILYDEYVEKDIKNNPKYKVGDLVYTIYSHILSRQFYGIGIIGFDMDTYEKVLIEDGEGEPELPEWIIKQLRKNKVTYDSINDEMNTLYDRQETIDALPGICHAIMGRDPIID